MAALAAVCATLLAPAPAPAAPPPNDDFANALPLFDRGRNDNATGSTVEATREPGEPAHGGFASGASIWFKWTAWYTGTAKIYPCNGSFHPVIAVYTGSAVGALTPVGTPIEVGPTNDFCTLGGHGGVALPAVAGQTYAIAVDGAAGETGWVSLVALDAPIPPYSPHPRIGRRIGVSGHRAKIRFQADAAIATFLCKLDRAAAIPCSSPVQFTGLAPGLHRIAVTAVGEPGAPVLAPAVRHFRIKADRRR